MHAGKWITFNGSSRKTNEDAERRVRQHSDSQSKYGEYKHVYPSVGEDEREAMTPGRNCLEGNEDIWPMVYGSIDRGARGWN